MFYDLKSTLNCSSFNIVILYIFKFSLFFVTFFAFLACSYLGCFLLFFEVYFFAFLWFYEMFMSRHCKFLAKAWRPEVTSFSGSSFLLERVLFSKLFKLTKGHLAQFTLDFCGLPFSTIWPLTPIVYCRENWTQHKAHRWTVNVTVSI